MSSPSIVRRRHPSPGFIVANTTMLWISTAIASSALWPIYQDVRLVILVVVATLLATIIAILGALFRWPAYVVLLTSVAVYFAVGVPLAVPSRTMGGILPSPDGLLDLLSGTALAWKQLLTITLPVGGYQALLVPALILVLVSGVASLSIALRARWGELGTIGPIVIYLVANLFGSPVTFFPLESSLALLAAILVWLVWWRSYRRRVSIRLLASQAVDAQGRPLETVPDRGLIAVRTLISALLIMAIAGAGAVVAVVAIPPSGPRDVLRSSIQQPFDPRSYPSPLSGFRRYLQGGNVDGTMLSVSGLPDGARIRIATLDTYDGIVYSVGSDQVSSDSGSFTRVPYAFDQSKVRGKRVTVDITINDYSGIWLPTVGQFESVNFSGGDATSLRDAFYYNNTSGTAAVVAPLKAGDSYSLTAIEPAQPDSLSSLRPGSAVVPQVGVVPDSLTSTLDEWVRGVTGQGKQLEAMIAAMKANGYISHGILATEPTSRSGHAADRITQLLTDQRMIGDQEQYAVTAALMARQLGFPARVVLGFVPKETNATGPTAVTGSDISAWIEVDTAQYGWVTIDPTPPVRVIPKQRPQDPTTIARPQSPVQPPVTQPDTQSAQTPPENTQDQPTDLSPFLLVLFAILRVLAWVLLVAAIVLAPFIAIIAAKLRRRRLRRRAPTPLERISGGWQEYEDAVLDHGFEPPAAATRTEVAGVVGGMKPLVLASIADRAVFAPTDPEAEEADQVWRSVGDLVASLDDGRTRWERIKAAISLRSLGGYSVRKLFKR